MKQNKKATPKWGCVKNIVNRSKNMTLNVVYDYEYTKNENHTKLYIKSYNVDIETKNNIKCTKIKNDINDVIYISNYRLDINDSSLVYMNEKLIAKVDFYEQLKNIEKSTAYYYYSIEKIIFKNADTKSSKLVVKEIHVTKHIKTKIYDILADKPYQTLSLLNTNIFNNGIYYFKINDNINCSDINNISNSDLHKIMERVYSENNIFEDKTFNNIHKELISIKMLDKKYVLDIVNTYDTETTNTYIDNDIVIDKEFINSIEDENMYKKFTDTSISNIALTYNYNFNLINKLFGISFNVRTNDDFEKVINIFNKIFSFKDITSNFFVHNFTHDFFNTESTNYRFDSVFMTSTTNVLTAYLEPKEKTLNIKKYYAEYQEKISKYNKNHVKQYAIIDEIEFRNTYVKSNLKFTDSYILLNKSLEKACKDLPTKNIDNKTLEIFKDVKMSGDLDYELSRNQKTTLTYKEIMYIANDTYGLNACILNELLQYASLKNLPLTSTGKPRNYMKEMCRKYSSKQEQEYLKKCVPNKYNLDLLEKSFAGGYTNGNFNTVGKLIETKIINSKAKYKGCFSVDLSSAYPFQCVSQVFPYELINKYYNVSMNFVKKLIRSHKAKENTAVLKFKCTLKAKRRGKYKEIEPFLLYASKDKNEKIIKDENNIVETLIDNNSDNDEAMKKANKNIELRNEAVSKSAKKHRNTKRDKDRKNKKIDNNVFNGRYKNIKNYHGYGSIIDIMLLQQIYDITDFVAEEVHVYSVGYLPKWYIEAISSFYIGKTSLKGTDDLVNYMNSKGNLNSIYGMMVQKMNNEIFLEDNDFKETLTIPTNDSEEEVTQLVYKLYQWGVFITAYTRQLIIETALKFGERYIYSDTDSIKFASNDIEEDFKKIIEPINNIIRNSVQEVCKYYKLDYNKTFNIANKDGIKYEIGVFDIENSFLYNDKKYSYAEFVQYTKVNNLNINIWEYIKPYASFKYICPKKYTYMDYDYKSNQYVLQFTISGVSKEAINKLIQKQLKKGKSYIEIQDKVINYGLQIPEGETGKSRGIITREKFPYTHTDYQGNTVTGMHLRGKSLAPAKFQISATNNMICRDYEYLDLENEILDTANYIRDYYEELNND